MLEKQEIYNVVEVATVYGYSLIGKLIQDNGKLILKDTVALIPAPQGIAFKPIGHLSLITNISIEKQFILGYSKITDLEVIKKYEDTIIKLNALFSGLEIAKNTNNIKKLNLE